MKFFDDERFSKTTIFQQSQLFWEKMVFNHIKSKISMPLSSQRTVKMHEIHLGTPPFHRIKIVETDLKVHFEIKPMELLL